jgi:starvation-inducible outer membrane lipoprotein
MRALRRVLAVILALLLTACATTPPAPPAPTWTELYLYQSMAARRGLY